MQNIIYIVNINDPNYGRLCISSWKSWASKNNCEVVVLDKPFGSIEPHWYKVYPFALLENSEIDYNRVLVVDNDTIVHPNCPNFFEVVPEEKIGVVFDDSNFDWTIRSTDAYHHHVFSQFNRFDTFEYFNSGFLVLSRLHKEVYSKVIDFLGSNYNALNEVQKKYGVGRDQTPLNFLLREYSNLKFLSKKFNCQSLLSKEIIEPKKLEKMVYVSHFNSMPKEQRFIHMNNLYKYFYE